MSTITLFFLFYNNIFHFVHIYIYLFSYFEFANFDSVILSFKYNNFRKMVTIKKNIYIGNNEGKGYRKEELFICVNYLN